MLEEVTLSDLYEGIEASLEQLPEATAHVAKEHIQLLRQAGITSVEGLATAVKEAANESIQLAACDLLGRLGDSFRRSAQSLADLFARTEKTELVWESAKALALMNASHMTEALTQHLDDADSARGAAAAWTLGRLGNASSVESLRAALRKTSADDDVRAHAAEALGALKSHDALMDLLGALDDPSADVRYWAAYALGEIGDPAALPALDRLAESDRASVGGAGSVAAEASSAAELIRTGKG